jgi:hypothetical protein
MRRGTVAVFGIIMCVRLHACSSMKAMMIAARATGDFAHCTIESVGAVAVLEIVRILFKIGGKVQQFFAIGVYSKLTMPTVLTIQGTFGNFPSIELAMLPFMVRPTSAGNMRRVAEIGFTVSTVDTESLWEERIITTRHRLRNLTVLADIFDAVLVHSAVAITE